MKIGIFVIAIGFILNVLETWYFGWNMKAQSITEAFVDYICALIIAIGFIVFAISYYYSLRVNG